MIEVEEMSHIDSLLSRCQGAPYSNIQQRVLGHLWAGYGQIVAVQATNGSNQSCSLIIKQCIPPQTCSNLSEDHLRKLESYRVESCFYTHISSRMRGCGVLVPELKGVFEEEQGMTVVTMGDLGDHGRYYTKKGNQLDLKEGRALLSWLARFHAVYWKAAAAPQGIWEEGSFWQLGTRRGELDQLDQAWVERGLDQRTAEIIHDTIRKTRFRTVIHGDAKSANFFFFDGDDTGPLQIGGYDFQYCGMATPLRDVAYFLCCSMKQHHVSKYEDELLLHYYTELCAVLCAEDAEEYSLQELRTMYDLCVVDLARFMAGSRWWGNVDYIENKALSWLAANSI